MESICERDFLKIYTAFEKSTRGKWKMDLFSNRLRFNFKNRSSRITIPSIWKLLEGVVFENGQGYSRIYLSYLSCKLEFLFICWLHCVIKTNTTRKPTTYIRRSHGILPGCKQGTDVRCNTFPLSMNIWTKQARRLASELKLKSKRSHWDQTAKQRQGLCSPYGFSIIFCHAATLSARSVQY